MGLDCLHFLSHFYFSEPASGKEARVDGLAPAAPALLATESPIVPRFKNFIFLLIKKAEGGFKKLLTPSNPFH